MVTESVAASLDACAEEESFFFLEAKDFAMDLGDPAISQTSPCLLNGIVVAVDMHFRQTCKANLKMHCVLQAGEGVFLTLKHAAATDLHTISYGPYAKKGAQLAEMSH